MILYNNLYHDDSYVYSYSHDPYYSRYPYYYHHYHHYCYYNTHTRPETSPWQKQAQHKATQHSTTQCNTSNRRPDAPRDAALLGCWGWVETLAIHISVISRRSKCVCPLASCVEVTCTTLAAALTRRLRRAKRSEAKSLELSDFPQASPRVWAARMATHSGTWTWRAYLTYLVDVVSPFGGMRS